MSTADQQLAITNAESWVEQQHQTDVSPIYCEEPNSSNILISSQSQRPNLSITNNELLHVNNLAASCRLKQSTTGTDYNIRPWECRELHTGSSQRYPQQHRIEPWQQPRLEASVPESVSRPEAFNSILTMNRTGNTLNRAGDSLNRIEIGGAVLNNGCEYSAHDCDDTVSASSDSSSNSTVVKEDFQDDSELFGGSIGLFTGLSNLQRTYNDTWLIGGNTSLFGAIFIVCNAALGIGVVNIPHAVLSIGDIYIALATQCVVVCLVVSTLFLLGFCAEKCQVSSYECVVGSLWGPKVRLGVELIIVLNGFFACIMFLIIAGDQLPHVLCLLDGSKEPGELREMSIVLSSLVILPLCIPKDISYLSYPGLVSVVAVTYLPIAIIFRYYKREQHTTEESSPSPSSKFTDINFTWLGLLHALPTFVLAYQCHLSCVPCYASLKKRSMTRWALIISTALVVVSVIYAVVGFFGFMTFGNETKSDVLLNYASSDDVITLGRLTLLASVLFSYPNMHFVSRSAYQSLLRCTDNVSSPFNSFFTPAWLLGTLSSALFIPEIGIVINRFGPVAAFFILGFPGLCLIKLSHRSYTTGCSLLRVIIGLIGGVIYCCMCALVLTCSLLSFDTSTSHHTNSHSNMTSQFDGSNMTSDILSPIS